MIYQHAGWGSIAMLCALLNLFPCCINSETADCSALTSYVAITSPESVRSTLLSAQALFAPYSYFLSATEAVFLSKEDANGTGCVSEATDLMTDVAGKIVILWRGGDCTEQYKVSIMETAGAEAVFIANNEDGTYVETITDDDTFVGELSVAARMITQESGEELEAYLEAGSVNGALEMELGCLNTDYPAALCVVDYNGAWWYLDGEYQQEGSDILTWNAHPVFTKQKYYGLRPNNEKFDGTLYMYLDDMDGDEDWRWTIGWTYDLTYFEDDEKSDYIVAYCANTSVASPANCSLWMTTNNADNDDNFKYIYNTELAVSEDLCDLAETYICIESDRSIAALGGTYKLVTESTGLWTRELSAADKTVGFIQYALWRTFDCNDDSSDDDSGDDSGDDEDGGGSRRRLQRYAADCYKQGWYLFDSVDGVSIAYCFLDDDEEYPDDVEFEPWLCDDWYAVEDSSIDDSDKSEDETFSVSDGICSDYDTVQTDTSDPDDVSHVMCLQDHALLHTFLQGTYEMLPGGEANHTTPDGRHIWYLPKNADSSRPAYMYYYGGYDADKPWWVIANGNPNDGSPDRYAYCPADVVDPMDCASCWFFYYGSTRNNQADYDADCEVELTAGQCEATTTLPAVDAQELDTYYPPTLCTYYTVGMSTSYIGEYVRSTTTINGRYYYIQTLDSHAASVSEDDVKYIVYDNFWRFWTMGDVDVLASGRDVADYFCPGSTAYNPSNCEDWYSGTGSEIGINIYFFEEECKYYIEDSSSSSDSSDGETVAWVVVIVVLLVCIIIAGLYYKQVAQRNKVNAAVSFRADAAAAAGSGAATAGGKKGHASQKSDMIELGDGATQTGSGGYNMETLNKDDLGEDPAAAPQTNKPKHVTQPSDAIELGDGDIGAATGQ